METLNLKLEGEQKTLEVRTGQSLPLKEPRIVNISGDINTIKNYVQKRLKENGYSTQGIFEDKTIVYANKFNGIITIDIDPENAYGAKVTGKLEISDELRRFNIDNQTTFTRETLVKLLRFSKRFFDSADVYQNIFNAYSAFKATAITDHEASSDNRGNKAKHFSKQVDSNLPTNFVLNIPIFKGQPNERFMVEICLELTDAGAHFWFESPELEELKSIRTDEIFAEQLKSCEGLVIVNV